MRVARATSAASTAPSVADTAASVAVADASAPLASCVTGQRPFGGGPSAKSLSRFLAAISSGLVLNSS